MSSSPMTQDTDLRTVDDALKKVSSEAGDAEESLGEDEEDAKVAVAMAEADPSSKAKVKEASSRYTQIEKDNVILKERQGKANHPLWKDKIFMEIYINEKAKKLIKRNDGKIFVMVFIYIFICPPANRSFM